MSQRPTLDRSSFERLLFAAWVLQCQHEQDTRKHPPVASPVNQELSGSRVREPLRPQWELGTASVGHRGWRASQALLRAHSWLSSTAIGGASYRQGSPGESPGRHLSPLRSANKELPGAATHRPVRLRIEALGRSLHHVLFSLLKAAERVKNRLESFAGYRVKVRVTLSPRRAVAAGAPLLVLPIMVALTLFQVWQPEGFRSVAAMSGMNHPSEKNAFRKAVIPPLPGSHRRITDLAALLQVEGLSKHEISALQRQAHYGDDSAALVMGMLYETGRYVPQSCATAADWVTRSANWGNAAAQYNLGLRYRDGDGLPVNEEEAKKWLRRAADHKYAKAGLTLEALTSTSR